VRLSFQTVQFSPEMGARVSFTAVLDAAAAAGFTEVGLDAWSVEAWSRAGGGVAGLGRLLADRGLSCTDVLPLIVGADRATTLDAAARLATLASATGAALEMGLPVNSHIASGDPAPMAGGHPDARPGQHPVRDRLPASDQHVPGAGQQRGRPEHVPGAELRRSARGVAPQDSA
jgi:sugar phosphate isomerase/epimerase